MPANAPRTVVGMPMSASASPIARRASSSVAPSARLNEIVVASSVSWWFTEVAVGPSTMRAIADNGTRFVGVLLRTFPVDALRSAGFGETGADSSALPEGDVADEAVPALSIATTCPPMFTSDVPGTCTSESAFGLCV